MGAPSEKKNPVKAGLKWGAIGAVVAWFLIRPQCISCDGSKLFGFITEEMFIKSLMAAVLGITAFVVSCAGTALLNRFRSKN